MHNEYNRALTRLAELMRTSAWVQIATASLSGNSLRQTDHTHRASPPSSEISSSPLKGCEVTAGLAESNGSLP